MVDYRAVFVPMTDDFINIHLENGVAVFVYVLFAPMVCHYIVHY